MNQFRINQSIDISYLNLSPINNSELEEVLSVAQNNQNFILEESDFSIFKYAYPTISFLDFRIRIITDLVHRHSSQLKNLFPDFSEETLIKIITKYSNGVNDIQSMIQKLVHAMTQQKHLNFKAVQLFALTWVNITTFGEIHKQWLEGGGHSVLPGIDVECLIANFLNRFEKNQIKLGIQSQKSDSISAAVYDMTENSLDLHSRYLFDPINQDNQITPLTAILMHEIWHAEQDANKRKLSHAEIEVESYLLDSKISLIMKDSDSYLAHIKKENDKVWNDILDAAGDPNPKIAPQIAWCQTFLSAKNPQGKNIAYSRYKMALLAKQELETGIIDQEDRKKMLWIFSANHWLNHFSKSLGLMMKNLSKNPNPALNILNTLPKNNSLPDISKATRFDDPLFFEVQRYFNWHLKKMMYLSYEEGIQKAKEYLIEVFFKEFYTNFIPKTLYQNFQLDGVE